MNDEAKLIQPPLNLSVIAPCFNEEYNIPELSQRVRSALDRGGLRGELILVDDGSTDGTRELLESWTSDGDASDMTVIFHTKNRGKGAALRRGFAEALGELIVIQDADLEYDPREYPRLLAPILEGKADVVYGSRFIGSDAHRVLLFWHSVGNRFLTLLSNALTNLNLTDMETCYKVFRAELLHKIELRENRFGFEPEVTAKMARLKVRIYEVGISYSGRTYQEGKKINWRDGVSALRCILKYGLFRR